MRDAQLMDAPALAYQTSPAARVRPAARRPVRVCFLIDELAPAGTEMQLLSLLRTLDRRRVAPYLCLLRGTAARSRALEPADCPVVRLGVGSLHSPATLARAWQFARFLRREQIDVVQAYYPDSIYFGLTVARAAGVSHRIRVRNNLGHWLTPRHRWLNRLTNGLVTHNLTNCAAARDALIATESVAPDSVSVLANGVEVDRFAELPLPEDVSPAHVGMIANLRPVKGLDVFLQAAAIVAQEQPGVRFTIVGEGPLRPELEREAEALGLGGALHLPGSTADVPSFLSGVHVAVLSSHAEGMSNALLEYMTAGRPIVATKVGAAEELIEHEVHGLLVPPRAPRSLASAILDLLRDRGQARRLAQAARRRACDRYSRATTARRFEDFYDCLVVGRDG